MSANYVDRSEPYLLAGNSRNGLLSWLNGFVVLPDETVGGAIRTDLALCIVDAIVCIIRASAGTSCARIVYAFDAGLNIFGLDLFIESVAGKNDAKTFKPFAFVHRGIKITLEPVADVDTRHY